MRILLQISIKDEDEDENGADTTVNLGSHKLELDVIPRIGDTFFVDEIIDISRLSGSQLEYESFAVEITHSLLRKDEEGFYYEFYALNVK